MYISTTASTILETDILVCTLTDDQEKTIYINPNEITPGMSYISLNYDTTYLKISNEGNDSCIVLFEDSQSSGNYMHWRDDQHL